MTRWQIELMAWVPQELVDPDLAGRDARWRAGLVDLALPGATEAIHSELRSWYPADEQGALRCAVVLGFDQAEGGVVSGVISRGHHAPWTRHWQVAVDVELGGTRHELLRDEAHESRPVEEGQAAGWASAEGARVVFGLCLQQRPPFEHRWPGLDADLTGSIEPDGTIRLRLRSDRWPSFGVRIRRDEAVLHELLLCDGNGLGEVAAVRAALVAQDFDVERTLPPPGQFLPHPPQAAPSAAQAASSAAQETEMSSKNIMQVDDATLVFFRSAPPSAELSARGLVNSTGWTDPRLVQRPTLTVPADGIYDFDFVATPPSGPAGDAIVPIAARERIDPLPEGFRGARVHAESGSVLARQNPGDVQA